MSIVIVVLILITASLINLAIQVRKARAQEVRASWSASPWGQARASKARAEEIWKTTFQSVYQKDGWQCWRCLPVRRCSGSALF